MRAAALFLAAAAVACPGCRSGVGGEPEAAAGPAPSVQPPWTSTFYEPAVLVADEVRIEGPPGLIEHVAVRQDPWNTDYSAKTTEAGLLQETVVKPGRAGIEVHAQLDAWSIVAMKKLVVLERPGAVPVVVTASGNAFYSGGGAEGSGEGGERRGQQLRFASEEPAGFPSSLPSTGEPRPGSAPPR